MVMFLLKASTAIVIVLAFGALMMISGVIKFLITFFSTGSLDFDSILSALVVGGIFLAIGFLAADDQAKEEID